jgi:hypothetical protein
MQIFAYKCQDLNEVMIVFEILTVVLTKLAKFEFSSTYNFYVKIYLFCPDLFFFKI